MLKIGHRGARAYEPENTLRSFQRAMELGVDAVELDVGSTRDEEVVVIHDAKVDKITNGKGMVGDLTLNEIKQLTTGEGERIPTLEEALDLLDRRVKVIIELKERGLEKKVLKLVHDKNLKENIILVSFSEEVLREIRRRDDEVETGLIYVRHKNPIRAALDVKASYLLPLYRFTHTANVRKAHEKGLKILVWTINKQEEVLEYGKKGVDGIASDRPDILQIS